MKGIVSASAANALFFEATDARLADLVTNVPELPKPIRDFLKSDPNESEGEARFKRALEGLGLGVLSEGLVIAFRGIRAAVLARRGGPARTLPNSTDLPDMPRASEAMDNAEGVPAKEPEPRNVETGNKPAETPARAPSKVELAPPEARYADETPEAFARRADGSIDLYRFHGGAARAIEDAGFENLPIRLQRGAHPPEGEGLKFGAAHIRERHWKEIKTHVKPDGSKYSDVEDFVTDILNRYNEIRIAGNDGLTLIVRDAEKTAKKESQQVFFARLQKSADGTFWQVRTAGVFKNPYLERHRLIWPEVHQSIERRTGSNGASMQPPTTKTGTGTGEPSRASTQSNGLHNIDTSGDESN